MARFRIAYLGNETYVEADPRAGVFTIEAPTPVVGVLLREGNCIKIGGASPEIDEQTRRQIEAALNRPPPPPSRPFGAPY